MFDIKPYFEIAYIDKFGVAILEFNEFITLPQNKTDINSTVLTLTIESESELYWEQRKLEFTWTALNVTTRNLTLQIVWENPPYISQSKRRDRIVVELVD